jgi:hypothetical protein
MDSLAKQPEFVIGELFTFSGIVDAAIRAIDFYSRWEVLASLQRDVPFLAHPITPILLVVVGLILIQRSMRRVFAASLNTARQARLHDEHGKVIAPFIKLPSMVPTYGVIAAGILVSGVIALVWIMTYAAPVPAFALAIKVPPICKTADCFPRAPKAARSQTQSTTVVNAPGGIPIVGNSGVINNPTVNNLGLPDRHVSREQRDAIVASIDGVACKFSMGALTTVEDAMSYANEIRDAFRSAGCVVDDFTLPLVNTAGGWYGVDVIYHDDVQHKQGEPVFIPFSTPAGAILKALANAHIPTISGGDPNVPKDTVEVAVGRQSK